MKYINQILFWAVVLFVIVLFDSQIGKFVNDYIVGYDYSNIWIKSLYSIISILFAIICIDKIKIFNPNLLLNSICLSFIYLFYRQNLIIHSGWNFAILLGKIRYADVLFIPLLVSCSPLIRQLVEKMKNRIARKADECDIKITSNAAIERKDHDEFGFAQDAENLLKVISKNREQAASGAIVIQLKGEWGRGKTSYLNLMRECALSHQDIILTRINVWQSHDYKDLVRLFLRTIGESINDVSIKSNINDYAKIIINSNIAYLSNIISIVKGDGKKNPEELFQIISKQIKALNKTLIVQVDDLDRLTSEEVLYTLKLIRNITDFSNTFFIVACDEEYIKDQLSEINIKESYLEKIFNIVYPLPVISKSKQIELIKKLLTNSIYLDVDTEIVINRFMNIIDNNISFRSAKRLSNTIQCGLSDIKDEDGKIKLDLLDYILINYLQIINQDVYDYLANFKNDNSFQIEQCIRTDSHAYLLNFEKDLGGSELTEEEYKNKRLSKYVGNNNIDLIYRIFKEMFNGDRGGLFRICYRNSFHLYFNRKFDKQLIGRYSFEKSLHEGREKFEENFKEWCGPNYDRSALIQLVENYQCKTKEEWNILFDTILNIVPPSYVKYHFGHYNRKDLESMFIPTPGLYLLSTKDQPPFWTREILFAFLHDYFFNTENLKNNSLDVITKKLTLLIENKDKYCSQLIINYSKGVIYNYKRLFYYYWSLYMDKGGSYNCFDEDLWYMIRLDNRSGNRIEMSDFAKQHIKFNIDNFINNYPVDILAHTIAIGLFSIPDANGYVGEEWIPNFKKFLESIEKKSEKLQAYIQEFNNKYPD